MGIPRLSKMLAESWEGVLVLDALRYQWRAGKKCWALAGAIGSLALAHPFPRCTDRVLSFAVHTESIGTALVCHVDWPTSCPCALSVMD